MIILIVIAGAFVGGLIVGVIVGGAQSPATITPMPNDTQTADCAALCNQWDGHRQEVCNAEADETSARNRATTLAIALAAAAILAVAASAAVVAALAGVITALAAIPLGIVAAAAWAVVGYLTGQLLAANSDLAVKAGAASAARNALAEARRLLVERCGENNQAQLLACLGRPAPC
jgi:hypothetical protein